MVEQAVHSLDDQIAQARRRCYECQVRIRNWENGDREHLTLTDYKMAQRQLNTWSQILDVRLEIRDRVRVR